MTHPDDDLLIDLAIGTEPVPEDVRDHVRGCARCQAAEASYRRVTNGLRADESAEQPPPGTWEGIAATIGASSPANPQRRTGGEITDGPAAAGTPSDVDAAPARRTRASRWWALAAAAALLVGVGVGWLIPRDDSPEAPPAPVVLAGVPLAPPDGGESTGEAELVRADGVDRLDLRVPDMAPPAAGEVHEVWLIHRDGARMVSLGVMPDGTSASFPVPAALLAQGYEIVDVSVEPLDDDATHSGNSLLRGDLGT